MRWVRRGRGEGRPEKRWRVSARESSERREGFNSHPSMRAAALSSLRSLQFGARGVRRGARGEEGRGETVEVGGRGEEREGSILRAAM